MQSSTAAVLQHALQIAAEDTYARNHSGTPQANGNQSHLPLPKAVKSNLARLGASLRRLRVTEDGEYDEEEYEEAGAAMRMAAIKCAGQTRYICFCL